MTVNPYAEVWLAEHGPVIRQPKSPASGYYIGTPSGPGVIIRLGRQLDYHRLLVTKRDIEDWLREAYLAGYKAGLSDETP